MAAPAVTNGTVREFALDANLAHTTGAAANTFLEDPTGTVKRPGTLARTQRLGDPINLGPNSTWHQLSWEGGELQDVWNDKAMYQSGDVDVLQLTGKAQMWPGFVAWYKNENSSRTRSWSMCTGSSVEVAWQYTPLYCGERDGGWYDTRAPKYHLWKLTPGYGRGDPRNTAVVHSGTEPYRFMSSAQNDSAAGSGLIVVGTATHMYTYVENVGNGGPPNGAMIEDTNAPATSSNGFEYGWDSVCFFNDAMYYLHGPRLMKRVALAPFGTLGTHTSVKVIRSAHHAQGLAVWNNRMFFGVQFPNGTASVYVSDGATTTKAFDFPTSLTIHRIKAVAGALYILGIKTTDAYGTGFNGGLAQQVWRYDGTSLKKLWQEGTTSDNEQHWNSDLCEWNGYVVWGRQGTISNGGRANLMFYDPINDAIVRGPGLDRHAANVGSDYGVGLWITAIHPWLHTLAVAFKDDTVYSESLQRPGMIATMRPPTYVKNDLRFPMAGDIAQFQPTTGTTAKSLISSEYHGPDDVALEPKTWLAAKLRLKLTGTGAQVQLVAYLNGDLNTPYNLGTITDDGTHLYQDITLPCKNGSVYLKSRKIQYKLILLNVDTNYDSTDNPFVDDIAIQYIVSPKRVRQWQIRVPVNDNQAKADGLNFNSLTTAKALADALETYHFNGAPLLFWEPGFSQGGAATCEVRIIDFQRQEAKLDSTDTAGTIGTCTLTLIENVTS